MVMLLYIYFVNVINYVDCFPNVPSNLHSEDELHLTLMKHPIEDFYNTLTF